MADPDSGELTIAPISLSRRINIKTKELTFLLKALQLRDLIEFEAGDNLLLDSRFKILFGQGSLQTEKALQNSAVKLDSTATNEWTVNGKDRPKTEAGNGTGFFKKALTANVTAANGSRSGKKPAPTDTAPTVEARRENLSVQANHGLTAEAIARQLNDEDNLALYQAYIKRYAMKVILKAYLEVLNTPPERIKKTPGAYFTFLVKKYGSQSK